MSTMRARGAFGRHSRTQASNAGPDRVLFQSGLTGTITLTTGQLSIDYPVQIIGPGPGQITVSGNNASRVFYVNPVNHGDDVSISGLTITGGQVAGDGAGVRSRYADLTISDAVITGNTNTRSGGDGGGISAYQGTLTIDRTTISNNNIPNGNAFGGGIWTYKTPAVIRNTTISGNTANDDGGGFYVSDPPVPTLIQNSTISGNTATNDDGGGFYEYRDKTTSTAGDKLVIQDSTIAGNHAGGGGGGIYNEFNDVATTSLSNTIVSGNTADDPGRGNDLYGNFDAAFSLIHDTSVGASYAINQTGPNLLGVDPLLTPLASNGGPTQTMALKASSPAVDKGSAFGLTSDQRGVQRPIDFPSIPNAAGGDGSDIGAFELQPDNAIKLGKLKRNKHKGTGQQVVKVPLPAAGTLTIKGKGKGLKTKSKKVGAKKKVKLPVIPKGSKRSQENAIGSVSLKAKVIYQPTGNAAKTLKRKLKLLKQL